jgi:hypothetical protein
MGRVRTGIACVAGCIQDRLGRLVLLASPELPGGCCCRDGPRSSATDWSETLALGGRRWRTGSWSMVAHSMAFDCSLWKIERICAVVIFRSACWPRTPLRGWSLPAPAAAAGRNRANAHVGGDLDGSAVAVVKHTGHDGALQVEGFS